MNILEPGGNYLEKIVCRIQRSLATNIEIDESGIKSDTRGLLADLQPNNEFERFKASWNTYNEPTN
jgi:hypothetical protein